MVVQSLSRREFTSERSAGVSEGQAGNERDDRGTQLSNTSRNDRILERQKPRGST